MLYIQLGVSALISGILILLMVFVQYSVGQKLGETQEKIMVSQLSGMNERIFSS